MADFGLNEEERMVQQLAHEFAVKEIRPVAAYYDEHEELPRDVMLKANQLGLSAGMMGQGVSMLVSPVVTEELSWGDSGIAISISSSGLALAAIMAMATEDQKKEWFPKCVSTETELKLGAFGLTEPEAGSDVANISTTAVRDGDDYILNGTKRFITNGGIADVHVIFATEDKSKKWGGLCAFAIEKDTPGMSMGTVWKKMGIRASWTADVVLDDCRVPARNRLGPEPGAPPGAGGGGGGAIGALGALERTRPMIGCLALGVGRAAFEYAVDYSRERIQFGRPLIANQAIGFKLADMAMRTEAARQLLYKACAMMQELPKDMSRIGPEYIRMASMAKCYCGDVAMWVSTEAVQVLGGYGYIKEYPVERMMRDAKITQIYEGSNEIQRVVIANTL